MNKGSQLSEQEQFKMINPREDLFAKNVREFKEIFDKYGIIFWLDWGTLLGAVREGKMIAWDNDMDMGVFGADYDKIITSIPEFKKRGFYVNELPVPNTKGVICRKFSFTKLGCLIDIFPYYNIKDNPNEMVLFDSMEGKKFSIYLNWFLLRILLGVEMSSSNKSKAILFKIGKFLMFFIPKRLKGYFVKKVERVLLAANDGTHIRCISVPKHYFENLGKIKYYGEDFYVPSNVEDYLRFKYGENWKKPVRDWHWAESECVDFVK